MEKRIISFLLCFMLMITYGSPTMAANGDTKYQYDTRGQLVEVSNSNGTIYHDYDVNGNRIRKHSTGNLLINSSFETYTGTNGIADGWTRYGAAGDFKVVTTPVVSGSRAQQISVEGLGGVYQEVAVTGNSTYEIKGRVNITALSSGKVQLVVQYYDAAGNLLSDVRPAETGLTNAWTTIGGVTTAPGNAVMARIHLHLESVAPGVFIVDAVSFKKSVDSNLLYNESFEVYTGTNGIADGWTGYWHGAAGEYKVISSPVVSGNQAQQISMAGLGGLYQEVAVTGNSTYEIKGRVNITALSSGKVQLVVQYYDTAGKLLRDERPGETSLTNAWTTIGGVTTAPGNAVMARIHLHLESVAPGVFIVDAVSFKKSVDSNLLYNESFEVYTGTNGIADGWTGYWHRAAGEYKVISSPVVSGNQAQQISIPGLGGLYQEVAVTGNSTYEIKGRVNITALSSGKVQLVVQYYDTAGKLLRDERPGETSLTNAWTTIGGVTTAPGNAVMARIHLHLESVAPGVFIVDAVSFKKSVDSNLLYNESFEMYTGTNGIADGWTGYWHGAAGEYKVISSPVVSGNQAQQISIAGLGGLYQEVAITGNSIYEIKGWVNITALSSGKVQMVVQYYDASGNLLSDVRPAETDLTNAWTAIGGITTSPGNAVMARIHLHLESQAPGAFVMDAINFKKSK